MKLNDFSLLGGLLKSSGFGAMAAALAMMAIPAEVFAQDRGNGHRWRGGGGSTQTQTQNSGGGWRGSTSVQTQRSGGNGGGWNGGGWNGGGRSAQSQNSGGGWNRGGGSVQAPRGDGGGQRGWNRRGGSVQAPRGDAAGQRGWNRSGRSGGWNGRATAQTPQNNGGERMRSRGSWTADVPPVPRVNPDTGARVPDGQAVQTRRGGGEWSWQGGNRNWQGNRGTETVQRERGQRDGTWRNRDNSVARDGNRNWQNRDGNRSWRNRAETSSNWNNRSESWRDRRFRDSNRNWRDDNRSWRGNDRHRYSNDHRRWDRNWRTNNRYDWRHHRARHHDIYRIGRYYSPYHNHYYSRLSVGFFLDSLFYSSNYWIDDPWYYRLPPADGPYRWIRYYDDALLVDIYTGEVIDVIYDFFW